MYNGIEQRKELRPRLMRVEPSIVHEENDHDLKVIVMYKTNNEEMQLDE
jgi:hypothetical protein